ncbi:LysM peptidoglycan-binding domain-containing protein [Crystallibacter degradans]|uniref:LysM peptidoglycan-binding domain-containing protein n=1 Tax=Crystallibacter degradans TaxID=2726743 RepID=UPI0014743251|nr:hypothetical protein [Arthrobacter sp. SF27]NMR29908.1 hypothetical protein [Arthrobacter sp. SF27]
MKKMGTDTVVTVMIPLCGTALLWSGGRISFDDEGTWRPLLLHTYSELLASSSALIGLVIVAWWLVGIVCAVVGAVLERAGHARLAAVSYSCSPAFMKRLATAVIGLNLLAAPVAANAAAPVTGTDTVSQSAALQNSAVSPYFRMAPASASAGESQSVSPLWKPTAPPVSPGLIARPISQTNEESQAVTVEHGDTLWDIAAKDLGKFATDTEIAAHWPRWYSANKDVIGPDPAVLLPGQVLLAPANR